jgi:hypothetical protein
VTQWHAFAKAPCASGDTSGGTNEAQEASSREAQRARVQRRSERSRSEIARLFLRQQGKGVTPRDVTP